MFLIKFAIILLTSLVIPTLTISQSILKYTSQSLYKIQINIEKHLIQFPLL